MLNVRNMSPAFSVLPVICFFENSGRANAAVELLNSTINHWGNPIPSVSQIGLLP